jgi:hypothetical protein
MLSAAILLPGLALLLQLPIEQPGTSENVIDAAASCVGAASTAPLYSPPAWQLIPDSNFPGGVVGPAIDGWNNPSCNTNGTAFPQFTTTSVPGSKPVPVHYVTGLNPLNPRSCGQTTASGITIFTQAKMPNGTTTTCGPINTQIQNLEHEMGHQLDLADSACPGYIMSPVAFPPQTGQTPPPPLPRSIQSSECAEANQFNITPAEQPPPLPPSVCPPNCTCPASCQSGCDIDGVCLDDPCDTDPSLPECGNGECGPECDGGGTGGGGGGGGCGDDPCDDGAGIIILPPPIPPSGHLHARSLMTVDRRGPGCGPWSSVITMYVRPTDYAWQSIGKSVAW